jgi:hypothetical protein
MSCNLPDKISASRRTKTNSKWGSEVIQLLSEALFRFDHPEYGPMRCTKHQDRQRRSIRECLLLSPPLRISALAIGSTSEDRHDGVENNVGSDVGAEPKKLSHTVVPCCHTNRARPLPSVYTTRYFMGPVGRGRTGPRGAYAESPAPDSPRRIPPIDPRASWRERNAGLATKGTF